MGKLNIGYLGLNGGSIEIGNIRKINGDFSYWANSNVKAVEFPALEEVTVILNYIPISRNTISPN